MSESTQKYAIIVNGDNLEEAVEETAHLLYLLLGRVLRAHRREHSANCPYDDFALEALALLQRHRTIYSFEESSPPVPSPSE